MKLTVVIPFRDERKNLKRLVPALKRESEYLQEVIFIDHLSSDGGAKELAGFRVLQESGEGISAPLSRGIQSAKSEFVATLDADCLPEPGWAKAMIEALETSDFAVGETLSLMGDNPTTWEITAHELFRRHSWKAAHGALGPLPWGPTCNLGFRRKWFSRLGGLDPRASGAFDVDFCWRAVLSGANLVWAPHARVLHQRRKTAEGISRQFLRYGASQPWIAQRYNKIYSNPPRELAWDAAARILSNSKNAALPAFAFGCGMLGTHTLPKPLAPSRFRRPGSWLDTRGRPTSIVPGKGLVRGSQR